jgi:hypothetical protein
MDEESFNQGNPKNKLEKERSRKKAQTENCIGTVNYGKNCQKRALSIASRFPPFSAVVTHNIE